MAIMLPSKQANAKIEFGHCEAEQAGTKKQKKTAPKGGRSRGGCLPVRAS
jgi:hypothetical protein